MLVHSHLSSLSPCGPILDLKSGADTCELTDPPPHPQPHQNVQAGTDLSNLHHNPQTWRKCHHHFTATYPQFLPHQVAVEVVDDVWVLVFPHDKDLVNDELLLGLLGQVHGLDGHLPARGHLYSNVHCARRSATQGRKQCTLIFWLVSSILSLSTQGVDECAINVHYHYYYLWTQIGTHTFPNNHHDCFEPKSISASGWNRYCKPWQTDQWYSPCIWQRTWSQKWYVEWPHRSSCTVSIYSKVEVSK